MAYFRVSYRQTEYRHGFIEAESESAARQAWIELGNGALDSDEFDMAEDEKLLDVEES